VPVFIDGYEIDIAETEEHRYDATVTSDPVETGSNITDHVKLEPDVVTFTGVVSDTPFGDLLERRLLDDVHSVTAYETILKVRDAREPVTIETSLRKYESMILRNLSVPRSADTGDALVFTATFQEIKLVTNDRTIVRVAVPRARKKVKRGAKQIEEVAPAPATKEKVERSWLDQLIR
jgi:hypothetical protein